MTRTGSGPLPSRALDDRGFSIMELLVGISLTLVILATTLGALADGVRATETSGLLANMRHGVRSGLNLMTRDLMHAGQGIPQGGIPIPSGYGASPVVRPGPGNLVFPSEWQAIPAVTPGSALGGVFHGRVTDMITVLYADATLPLNTTALSSISADGSTVVVLVAGYANLGSLHQYFLKRYYYYLERPDSLGYLFSPMSDMPEVFRTGSRYQKIDIVHLPSDEILIDAYSTKYVEDPSQPRDRFLFLNGDLQVVSNYEEVYHEFFAHVPVLLHGEMPERVLVMGAGDGMLIRELLKYRELEAIRHVDLDPVLIELAKTHPTLTAMNGHALEDPRVQTTIGDAFQFIRTDPERYDAIYLDFPYVMDYNLSKLYSREFFHFVRAHLTDGGYAVLDAPASELFVRDPSGATVMDTESDWPVYYETLKGAGFETVVPFVSALELDNPTALQALSPSLRRRGLTGNAARACSLAYLGAHADGLMQGFILARRGPSREPRYRDLGIRLHVLNETRFHLAFAQPYPMRGGVDDDRVNSIMRPTMPTVPWWYTRAAW